jgi:Methyltransferase domain
MQQISQDQAASWYHGKQFTFDWTSYHFPSWFGLLKKFRSRKARVLEIGSWEGRSAIFFLNYLPRCTVVCVDSFLGGREHLINRGSPRFLRSVEKRFDSNIAEFGDRVEKIRASSADALAQLGLQGRRFDFAYIDGSHVAADVYTDALLTWPLIVRGGIVIFDDYLWDGSSDPLDVPKPGIDAFLKTVTGDYKLLLKNYQVAIAKRQLGRPPRAAGPYHPDRSVQAAG